VEPLSELTRTISTRFAGGTSRGKMQVYPDIELFFLVFVLKLLEGIQVCFAFIEMSRESFLGNFGTVKIINNV
jgi:hypothetical protein